MKIKIKCIDDDPRNYTPGNPTLVMGKVYEVEAPVDGLYKIDGLTWSAGRFKVVKDDEDCDPTPVTFKATTRSSNNEEESSELMDFFSRPEPGNCKCGGPKALCPYHKGT